LPVGTKVFRRAIYVNSDPVAAQGSQLAISAKTFALSPGASKRPAYRSCGYYKNGQWGEIEISSSEYINIHIAATCLHYGQECFEGMKVFRGKDGKIRVFRWEENAKRMQRSCEGVMMAQPPLEIFKEMMLKVIKLNERYIPPPGLGAALYLRPLTIGSGPQVGVKPAEEYMFMIFGNMGFPKERPKR